MAAFQPAVLLHLPYNAATVFFQVSDLTFQQGTTIYALHTFQRYCSLVPIYLLLQSFGSYCNQLIKLLKNVRISEVRVPDYP
jgi:hypothetical protein